jgi:hypothetical protein
MTSQYPVVTQKVALIYLSLGATLIILICGLFFTPLALVIKSNYIPMNFPFNPYDLLVGHGFSENLVLNGDINPSP